MFRWASVVWWRRRHRAIVAIERWRRGHAILVKWWWWRRRGKSVMGTHGRWHWRHVAVEVVGAVVHVGWVWALMVRTVFEVSSQLSLLWLFAVQMGILCLLLCFHLRDSLLFVFIPGVMLACWRRHVLRL